MKLYQGTREEIVPCCPKGAKPDPDKAALKASLVDLLGDDEDGITGMMEDFGL